MGFDQIGFDAETHWDCPRLCISGEATIVAAAMLTNSDHCQASAVSFWFDVETVVLERESLENLK